jgi:hypothetical protein
MADPSKNVGAARRRLRSLLLDKSGGRIVTGPARVKPIDVSDYRGISAPFTGFPLGAAASGRLAARARATPRCRRRTHRQVWERLQRQSAPAVLLLMRGLIRLAHDPEKHVLDLDRGWAPVVEKDHAQTKC